ncbi:S1C family serine protease [Persicobacter psychrovividus]|uniref:Serine protease n=1 Tax=Persicobacter psychrovividus TaxID=387638 RepID=A0ABM7VJ12_9BACT|nr:hypothetical protein PEPS_30550 [Persicobacter psychrovividus]
MRKLLALLLIGSSLLSSCATILNSTYQPVAIKKKRSSTILIDGKRPKKRSGKYLLKRDLKPKQITVKSKGQKDKNIVVIQSNKSPFYILSVVPFGILFFPMILDSGDKSFDYDRKTVKITNTNDISARDSVSKKIHINKVSFDIPEKKLVVNIHRYRDYRAGRKSEALTKTANETENIKLEHTIFDQALNNILVDKGFIDTTASILNYSYADNLLINAEITDYEANVVLNDYQENSGMMVIDLKIKWEILDYYKRPIYSLTTKSTSDEFAFYDEDDSEKTIKATFKDAIEIGFIEFMSNKNVVNQLHDRSNEQEERNMKPIDIFVSKSGVNDLGQAIKSSLTIKTKEGFGSGFIISNDGYIITNYHVVAPEKDLTVILNNQQEYEAELVRKSKTHDLALLKIKATNLTPFHINTSKNIELTKEVYAVGTPNKEDLSQTISKGIISGIRDTGYSKRIQTDASVNSGNSGGPLVDKQGNVLGVVASKLKGIGIEGVAFGIPAYEIIDQLKLNIITSEQQEAKVLK